MRMPGTIAVALWRARTEIIAHTVVWKKNALCMGGSTKIQMQ